MHSKRNAGGRNHRGSATLTHRTTIAAPRALVAEAVELGRGIGLRSLNSVIKTALEDFVANRRREAFAAAISHMATDPEILGESAAITELFANADRDGIP